MGCVGCGFVAQNYCVGVTILGDSSGVDRDIAIQVGDMSDLWLELRNLMKLEQANRSSRAAVQRWSKIFQVGLRADVPDTTYDKLLLYQNFLFASLP
ncbi:hypothetical protein F0562_017757 [Nyssa sinensis]|uniref:Uncharacterized protein n=1 Tax=Nyssa sinensis TaxID=561372 RepID=A0A5J4ZHU3_9ASTE|nr:hypothetical protein F0562_017757 [Nyssa sinensis]